MFMKYQDHLTKCIHLRPLKSVSAKDLCKELLKLFLKLETPIVFQSDSGREFVTQIIHEIIAKPRSISVDHYTLIYDTNNSNK